MGELISGRDHAKPGPNLSGKTTLANSLSKALAVPILDIDEGWRNKWGSLENRPPMPEVYAYNHQRALPYLAENKPVIIVATYSQPAYHEMLDNFARESQSPLRVFHNLPTDIEETKRRLEKRLSDPNDLSDVRTLNQVLEIQSHYHPISNHPNIWVMEIDGTRLQEENVAKIITSLSDRRKD